MKPSSQVTTTNKRSSFLRIIGALAILLSAILALGIVDVLFSSGPDNIWALAVGWVLFFGLGIAASELIISRATRIRKKWEEKTARLEKSRDSYREIANDIPYPLALVRDDGRIAYHNPAFLSTLKLQSDDISNLDFHDLIDPEERTDFRMSFIDCARKKSKLERMELKIVRGDKKRAFEALISPYNFEIDDRVCCLVLLRDLALRLDYIEKIEGLESLSKEIIYQSPIGILILDKSGLIESVNKAALRIFGLDYRDLINKNIFDETLPILDQFELVRSLENKVPYQEIKEVRVGRYLNKNIDISYYVFPVTNKENELIRVVFMAQDITDLIRAKTELDSQRERLSIFFDNAADAIFVTKKSGEITMVNPSAAELTGYDIDELVGMDFSDLFTTEEREIALRQNAWLERKNKVHYESIFLTAENENVDVDISGSKVDTLEGTIVLNVVRDVTERKNFISRLSRTQKMESIGEMAKGIALDFNNVLEAIIGAAELAQEKSRPEGETASYLKVILDSAKRGANLTRHLMNYARQDLIETELLDMNDIVKESVSFLEQSLEKNIRLQTDLDPNIGPISGDKSMILQAIINVALNAKDAMPEGGEIKLSTSRFDASEDFAREHPGTAPGPYVQLLIQDTGEGIDEEVLSKVFDPFFTTKSGSAGAGLGLPMVYNIAKTHGGSVDIKSIPYGGTEVRMFFPSPIIPDELEKKVVLQKTIDQDIKIMVVDDEDIIQTVIEGILDQLGYRVIRAQSGKEALEYLTDHDGDIDLILLDMIMPGLSGWDVFRRLKQFWPDIPVIVVTGYAQEEHLQYMIEEGLEGLIQKPFKASLLSEKIQEALSQRSQR